MINREEIEEDIKELQLEKEYLQIDKDKLFREYESRYLEILFTIRNIDRDIKAKREILKNGELKYE